MKNLGIAACSNGLKAEKQAELTELIQYLEQTGGSVLKSSCIYEKNGPFSGTGAQRAQALTALFADPDVSEIYDVSGGDLANEILPYLDYETIGKSRAVLWGYSDLTTVLNAIYAKTQKYGVLYQIRNLVGKDGEMQKARYENREELFTPKITMVRGDFMAGILVGGNIRCLLKLAGTEYFPDMEDKILLLEARSGKTAQMTAYLSQLKAMGVFEKVSGILLGTFTQMEAEACAPDMLTLVTGFAGPHLPIGKTEDIGHGSDSRAVFIGRKIEVFR